MISIAVIFTVLVGIPVMWLHQCGREFNLFAENAGGKTPLRPLEEFRGRYAGGRSGCSNQGLLLLAFGLLSGLGGLFVEAKEAEPVLERLLFGLLGPGFLLTCGPIRWIADLGFPPFFLVGIALELLLVAVSVGLAFLAGVQFAWISRLSEKVAGVFQGVATSPG